MSQAIRQSSLPGALMLFILAAQPHTLAASEMYATPSAEAVRSRALEWVESHATADVTRRAEIEQIWSDAGEGLPARVLFDKLIDTFCVADDETREFVASCRLIDSPLRQPEPALLTGDNADSFYEANLTLFYGRYLAQRRMYDEALDVLGRVDPGQVVDPATCFFYKAVCQHQLLLKDETRASLEQLLNDTENVPVSYSTLAELMKYDLSEFDEKTLGEVARKMRDSERRLDLGRGGQRVQKVQSEIVATLDEIIKKMEQNSGGGGGGSAAQGRNNRSTSPAQDSRVKGSTAPGEVDERKLTQQGGWGALPPKEEARAKNLINQKFPAHYREAVESYFKKLAKRRAEGEP